MPLDLSGTDLTEEQKAVVMGLHTADIELEVTGLKNKNNELIQREKDAKTAGIEAEEAAKVAAAEASGDLKAYKKALDDQKAALEKSELANTELTNKGLKADQAAAFMPKISDDPAAQAYMLNKFNESYDIKDGVATPNDVTLTMSQMQENLLKDSAHASYVKADVGSGGGSAATNSNGSSTGVRPNHNGNLQEQTAANAASNPDFAALPLR